MTNTPKTMTEWKAIENYPNYLVSTSGFIKSIKPGTRYKNHLKPGKCSAGYYTVTLIGSNGKKTQSIHRLVAQAFIPNPKNKRTVNHINGIKTDNRAENLEWMTYSENNKHSYVIGLSDHLRKISSIRFKKVLHLGSRSQMKKVLCTKTGKVFDSISAAAEEIKCSKSSLSNKLSGRHKNNTSLILIKDTV